jgi:hypothetical protein
MALKKDFEFKYPVVAHLPWSAETEQRACTLKDAYIRVLTMEGSKEEQRAAVMISSGDKQVSKTYTFAPDMNGPNFIKQAYEYLKTLPEFADAVDC